LGPGAGIAALATGTTGRLARPGGRPILRRGAGGAGSASRRSVRLPQREAGEAEGSGIAVREAGVVLGMVVEWKLCEVAVSATASPASHRGRSWSQPQLSAQELMPCLSMLAIWLRFSG